MVSTRAVVKTAAILTAVLCASEPLMTKAAQRVPRSVLVSPKITPALLVKQAFRHSRSAQIEAEGRASGSRAIRRAVVHAQIVANTKPVLLNTHPGNVTAARGRPVPTIVVSLLSYGLYPGDSIPLTRQIDYTYNAQNGALLAETAVIADAMTARRFGLPALMKAGAKK
jgi:hypothetical protein